MKLNFDIFKGPIPGMSACGLQGFGDGSAFRLAAANGDTVKLSGFRDRQATSAP